MRALVPLLLLALVLVPPTAPAETRTGGTYGANLGYWDAGNWNVFWWGKGAGPASVTLTWDASLFPGADYDLLLYAPGALDDGVLDEAPIAESSTRAFLPRQESLAFASLPPTTFDHEYVLAIVPHQTQGETYSLTVDAGYLVKNAGPVPGVRYCPSGRCPFLA